MPAAIQILFVCFIYWPAANCDLSCFEGKLSFAETPKIEFHEIYPDNDGDEACAVCFPHSVYRDPCENSNLPSFEFTSKVFKFYTQTSHGHRGVWESSKEFCYKLQYKSNELALVFEELKLALTDAPPCEFNRSKELMEKYKKTYPQDFAEATPFPLESTTDITTTTTTTTDIPTTSTTTSVPTTTTTTTTATTTTSTTTTTTPVPETTSTSTILPTTQKQVDPITPRVVITTESARTSASSTPTTVSTTAQTSSKAKDQTDSTKRGDVVYYTYTFTKEEEEAIHAKSVRKRYYWYFQQGLLIAVNLLILTGAWALFFFIWWQF